MALISGAVGVVLVEGSVLDVTTALAEVQRTCAEDTSCIISEVKDVAIGVILQLGNETNVRRLLDIRKVVTDLGLNVAVVDMSES